MVMPRLTEPVGHRLADECQVDGECLIWTGLRSKRGYGQIRHEGRTHLCHRVVYELLHGPIPDGMVVCHECDTPLCIHPDHLWLGTASENTRDCVEKGRHRSGFAKRN